MKYKITKEDNFWRGYEWSETKNCWYYIDNSISFTKFGCKYFVKKYHKKSKEKPKDISEEFELE